MTEIENKEVKGEEPEGVRERRSFLKAAMGTGVAIALGATMGSLINEPQRGFASAAKPNTVTVFNGGIECNGATITEIPTSGGANSVYVGLVTSSNNARIMLQQSSGTNYEIDNAGGTFRIFVPLGNVVLKSNGSALYSLHNTLDDGSGNTSISGTLNAGEITVRQGLNITGGTGYNNSPISEFELVDGNTALTLTDNSQTGYGASPGTIASVYYLQYNGGSLGSDMRMKEEIKTSERDFADIFKKINVYEYKRLGEPTRRLELGLIAQEVRDALPMLVKDTGNDAMLSIWQNDLLASSIGAIKQLVYRVEELENRLAMNNVN